jgi:serine protease Do
VVEGNSEVVIEGRAFGKRLAKVIYTDKKYDLAFLDPEGELPIPGIELRVENTLKEGEAVVAIGHPFGLKYTATQGILSNVKHKHNDLIYYQHDAAINPGNSGGPLVNQEGEIVGINTFIIRDGQNLGFSLPASYLQHTITEFLQRNRALAVRCGSCMNIVFEDTIDSGYCPNCGAEVELATKNEKYESTGIGRIIEDILTKLHYNVALARTGPSTWEVQRGTAKVSIYYMESEGIISGHAVLCHLPKENIKPIYEYLLRENFLIEGLNLGVNGQEIILTLFIFDRYFHVETASKLFQNLLDKADYYDNILVEQFGALWKKEEF